MQKAANLDLERQDIKMSRILIIEDEEVIADLEKDYLELSDFQVDICNKGDQGLQAALTGEYDLMIVCKLRTHHAI